MACEIISNACEHGKAPCISQIKVIDGLHERKTHDQVLFVSCSFVSFSDKTIFSTLKRSVENDSSHEKGKEIVKQAYTFHSQFFSQRYDEKSFYTISAFQFGVSSRDLKGEGGGGTGLTRLLQVLQENSLAEQCYVITGDTCIFFKRDSIEVNDGLVGFNLQGDYYNALPSDDCHKKLSYYFNGTIFNLVFIIGKGDSPDERDTPKI